MKRGIILLSLLMVVVIGLSGCAHAPKAVMVDAPKLAFALMFVGVCAVLCSSIGGFSIIKASRRNWEE